MPNGEPIIVVNTDGVFEIPGMPPGRGTEVIPHPATFLQLLPGGPSRVYRPSDEAIRQSRAHARFMRLDATVMECVELRQRATALLDWHIEVEDKSLKPIADELTRILRRIPRFVQYRDTLLSAIWYGRYAIENLYTWDWIDGKKRVVIDGWVPIHGDKLVWKIDSETGRIDSERWGIRIGTLSGASPRLREWFEENREYIEPTDWGLAYFPPPGKRELVVIHRHIVEDGEFEEGQSADRVFGVGIRSRIYWIWYQKQEALRWLMEFLERSAFGIELWYYPAGNLEAREHMLQAASQRVGTGRNILLVPRPPGPEGAVYGVERIEPSMAGAQALREILTDYFGHQIKRYILGQTLTTEAHATGLGSNLASIHLDTFLQIVKYDAANLQETLTDQLVRRLVEWNWPGVDARLFRFVIEVEKPDVAERLQALRQAFDMGLKLKAADVRDLLGIAAPGADDETLQNPSYARGPEMPGMQPGNMPMGLYANWQPRERYSNSEEGPRVGDIKYENGVAYRFNENHRWERVDEPGGTEKTGGKSSTGREKRPGATPKEPTTDLPQPPPNWGKRRLDAFFEVTEAYECFRNPEALEDYYSSYLQEAGQASPDEQFEDCVSDLAIHLTDSLSGAIARHMAGLPKGLLEKLKDRLYAAIMDNAPEWTLEDYEDDEGIDFEAAVEGAQTVLEEFAGRDYRATAIEILTSLLAEHLRALVKEEHYASRERRQRLETKDGVRYRISPITGKPQVLIRGRWHNVENLVGRSEFTPDGSEHTPSSAAGGGKPTRGDQAARASAAGGTTGQHPPGSSPPGEGGGSKLPGEDVPPPGPAPYPEHIPEVEFAPADPATFVQARDSLPHYKRVFLTPYTEQEIAEKVKSGKAQIYLSKDGGCGYMLIRHDDGRVELANLFNASGVKNAGIAAAIDAISKGANYLDCLGAYLASLYYYLGFEVEECWPFDDQYAPAGWPYEKWDRPPLYVMTYEGKVRDPAALREIVRSQKYGRFKPEDYPPK